MNYIFYYILHSYCCHPWWLVELQVLLLLLVLHCCNFIVIVIDATLFCHRCHPQQPINVSKQPDYEKQVARIPHNILLFPPFTTHQCFQTTTFLHNTHNIKSNALNKMQAQCSQVDVEEIMFIVPHSFQWSKPFLSIQHLGFLEGFGAMFFLLANFSHVTKKNLEFFWGFLVWLQKKFHKRWRRISIC